ncbi:unnamed protein product [Prunus armeniaca]
MGCASTHDVLLLDAVWLCAGVPARSTVRRDDDEVRVEDGSNDAPVLRSTPNQTIVAERGTDLGRQVHGLSYKAALWWCWWWVLGGAPARCSESDGCIIYKVSETITDGAPAP